LSGRANFTATINHKSAAKPIENRPVAATNAHPPVNMPQLRPADTTDKFLPRQYKPRSWNILSRLLMARVALALLSF
jgi:hypothetical protein